MRNVVLIGMPGVGKSTIGVLLAKVLGMPFADTDLLIQQRAGRLLQDIINQDGIDEFLKVEESVALDVKGDGYVIATGGSIVYSPRGMESLKKTGIIVYLKLPFDVIEKRIRNMRNRGIAIAPGKSLFDLYEERTPLYESYADIVIDCSDKDPEAVLSIIAGKLKMNANPKSEYRNPK
jgi:shikimate kinase